MRNGSRRTTLTRRDVIVGGLGATAAAGIATVATWPSPAPGAQHHRFQHGVASGDPLPTAVVLWTRITPIPGARPGSGRGGSTAVTWQVAADPAFARLVRSGSVRSDPARDHTVKIDASGLQPGTTYFYRFVSGPDVSPVGRTRTAPAADSSPERLRFGVVSCANWQAGHFSSYRHLASDDLDAVIHLGDYLYEYEPGKYSYGHDQQDVRRHDPPREIRTLEDYRRRHAQYKTDPDLQALHATAPFIATWDDHEVADGWWPGGAFEQDDAQDGPWRSRRAAALKAYDEWMPVRLSGTARAGDGVRIFRSLRFGDLAEITMLDLRSYRDERVDVGAPALDDGSRSITGRAQHGWLVDRLTSTSARWKLVGNPVMVAPMLMPPRPQADQVALKDTTDPMSWGSAEPNTDEWDGYPLDRRALLARIAEEGVEDVVFLSGDVHTAWANEVVHEGRPVATELVCASVTSNNVDDFMGTEPRTVSVAIESAITALNPHVRFVNLDDHGHSVVELTPTETRMEWHAISDRRDPRASSRLLAARRVRTGSARLLPT
ncbi:alkaline phosphatase D family protein [Aeromicrobium sp. Root495]|uniref:alkaline phosphatase D family protein n=1 Tax=Aeromicrobium sp. Root495 TaxID=1736550 RepID=UPI000A561A18|nr:alkaline phosphatase D family protein [Aeromicrobium sp. Root495]